MDQNIFQTANYVETEEVKHQQAVFMNKVYGWMSIALVVTGLMAIYTFNSDAIKNFVFSSSLTFYGIMIAEIALVIWLSRRITSMSSTMATLGFMAYAVLNGLTMSVIFFRYTESDITATFLATAGTFGVMSAFGYLTKRDLTGIGSMAYMALFGIIIAMIVNFFMQSESMSYVISAIGVIIFVALTAYDTQKIKNMAVHQSDGEMATKGAVLGALVLYLDFINLFLFLLRIFGGSRD